jgi:PKD repeat protein
VIATHKKLIIILALLILSSEAFAWCLPGWQYRRPITIDNTANSSTLTNYQVKITLDSTNFDFSKAKTNGEDIRFCDSDDTTTLKYWIESYDSTNQTATIWVKVPSIPASSSKTIYTYYGNSQASNASSISNTFIDGDDFESYTSTSDTAFTNKYTHVAANGSSSITTDGGKKVLSVTGGTSAWETWRTSSYAYTSIPVIIEGRFKYASFSNSGQTDFFGTGSGSPSYQGGAYNPGTDTIQLWVSGYYTQASRTLTQGQYYKMYVRLKNLDSEVILDGVSVKDTIHNPQTSGNVEIGAYNTDATIYVDFWFVREYASPEPSNTVGNEQSQGTNNAPTIIINYPNGGEWFNSSTTIIDINFTVSDADNDDVNVSLYYSTSQGAFSNAIATDLNVKDYQNIANLTCTSSDLTTGPTCTYTWDISGVSDSATYYIDANATDGTAFATDSSDSNFGIDKTPPSLGTVSMSGFSQYSNYFKGTGTISSQASDASGINTNSCEYSLDNGATWEAASWNAGGYCEASFTVQSSMQHDMKFRVQDNAGNIGTSATLTRIGDIDPPVSDDNAPSGWQTSDFVVMLTCSDAGVGCASMDWWVDGTPNSGGPPNYVTINTDGNHQIDYRSWDLLNNMESTKTTYAALDKTPPSTIDDAPSGWQTAPFDVNLTCTDATSGCFTTYYRVDGGTWQTGNTVSISTDGNHQIDYYSVDVAGNSEQIMTTYAALTPVVVSFTYTPQPTNPLDPENGTNTSMVDFNDTSTYNSTDPASYRWDVNGILFSTDQNASYDFTSPGDYNLCFTVTINSYSDTNCQIIEITQYPQDVNFTWTPQYPMSDIGSVSFIGSATDDNAITQWQYDFNDGNTSTDQNTSHTFSAPQDYNVCLTVTDDDNLQKTTCHTITVSGYLRVHFYDENTFEAIQPSVTINGTNYDANVDANGVLTLNLYGWSDGTYTMYAWDGNRTQRKFLLDLNQYVEEDFNALLLDTDAGRWVDFQMLAPDESTLLVNSRVRVVLDGNCADGNRISEDTTDSDANISFFFNPNEFDYVFCITASDGNTYTYYEAVVTIHVPKDELDPTTDITLFDVEIGGLARQSYSDLNEDLNIQVFSNTYDYYEITVGDSNQNYYDRTYFVKVRGPVTHLEIQPYLVSTNDGIVSWLYIQDQFLGQPIPQVLVVVQRQISDVSLTTISSIRTDDTGSTTVSWAVGVEYTIQFYIGLNYAGSVKIRPSQTTYYISINTLSIGEQPTAEPVYIQWYPNSGVIEPDDSNNYDLNVQINAPQGNIQSITVTLKYGSTVLKSTTVTENVAYGTSLSFSIPDANIPASSYPLSAITTITTSEGTFTDQALFSLYGHSTSISDIMESFAILQTDLGSTSTILLSFLVTIGVLGFVYNRFVLNAEGAAILGAITLGVFVLIGWVPFAVYVLALLGLGAVMFFTKMVRGGL